MEQVAANTLMGNANSNTALPSAIPVADILALIGGQEIIQYETMPTAVTEDAVVQYVGESNETYANGAWYRGESGEWVLVSSGGVYVGTGDMPAGYNLQIDPDGEVLDPDDFAPASVSVIITLSASAWSNGVQTVTVSGVTASSNGSLRIAQSATNDQFAAWGLAQPRVTAQAADSITVTIVGETPAIDIPVEVLIV